MNIAFTLYYATRFGENVFLHLSQDGVAREIPLSYIDAHTWSVSVNCTPHAFSYHYSIQNSSGQILREELPVRNCSLAKYANAPYLHIIDRWNLASFPEHFLFNKIWNIHQPPIASESLHLNLSSSHRFEIRVPLYPPHWALGLMRPNSDDWIPMHRAAAGLWQVDLDVSALSHGVGSFEYRYGIFDATTNACIHTETQTRQVQVDGGTLDGAFTIVHDVGYEV